MPDDDQFEDLMFPINGIDRSMEFELQPERTTPLGMNVRGFESETQRQRGGSRAGLIEYIPEQLGDVSAAVQHMNTVTFITDAGSLLTGDDTAAGGSDAYMADPSSNNFGPGGGYGIVVGPITISGGVVTAGIAPPPVIQGNALSPPASLLIPPPPYPPVSLGVRNPNQGGTPPGRAIRVGGSGVQPNRNVFTTPSSPPPPPPPPTITEVGAGNGTGNAGTPTADDTFAFTLNLSGGDLVIVVGQYDSQNSGTSASASVLDSLGNSYNSLGQATLNDVEANLGRNVEVWYSVPSTFGANTITMTATTGAPFLASIGMTVGWYKGANSAPLVSSQDFAEQITSGTDTFAFNQAVSGTGALVIFGSAGSNQVITGVSDLTGLLKQATNLSSAVTVNVALDSTHGPEAFLLGVAAGFHR